MAGAAARRVAHVRGTVWVDGWPFDVELDVPAELVRGTSAYSIGPFTVPTEDTGSI